MILCSDMIDRWGSGDMYFFQIKKSNPSDVLIQDAVSVFVFLSLRSSLLYMCVGSSYTCYHIDITSGARYNGYAVEGL